MAAASTAGVVPIGRLVGSRNRLVARLDKLNVRELRDRIVELQILRLDRHRGGVMASEP
jgi:hypothetical protein